MPRRWIVHLPVRFSVFACLRVLLSTKRNKSSKSNTSQTNQTHLLSFCAGTTKYFGIELGAQTKMDEKADRYIVNGAFTAEDLQNTLDGFITKFVLRPKCDNPETDFEVNKKVIKQNCAACGYTGPLKYKTHRLYNFILTHPPTPSKKQKQGKAKKGSESGKDAVAGDGDADGEDAAIMGDFEAPELDENRDDEDEEWAEDTSAEAIRMREETQMSGAVSKLLASADADLPVEQRVNLFHKFVEERKERNPFPAKEVFDKATVLELVNEAGIILVEVLLDEKDFLPQLQKCV